MLVKLRENVCIEKRFLRAPWITGIEFANVAESLVSGQLLPAVVIFLI